MPHGDAYRKGKITTAQYRQIEGQRLQRDYGKTARARRRGKRRYSQLEKAYGI